MPPAANPEKRKTYLPPLNPPSQRKPELAPKKGEPLTNLYEGKIPKRPELPQMASPKQGDGVPVITERPPDPTEVQNGPTQPTAGIPVYDSESTSGPVSDFYKPEKSDKVAVGQPQNHSRGKNVGKKPNKNNISPSGNNSPKDKHDSSKNKEIIHESKAKTPKNSSGQKNEKPKTLPQNSEKGKDKKSLKSLKSSGEKSAAKEPQTSASHSGKKLSEKIDKEEKKLEKLIKKGEKLKRKLKKSDNQIS